jgi:hypothetical protein
METMLEKFRQRRPYASEMFGVFQPLLGWKSALTKARLSAIPPDIAGLAKPAAVSTIERGLQVSLGPDYTVLVNADGVIGEQQGRPDLFADPPSRIRFRHPAYVDGIILRSLVPELQENLAAHPPSDDAFWGPFWTSVLSRDGLNKRFAKAVAQMAGAPLLLPKIPTVPSPVEAYVVQTRAMFPTMQEATEYLFNHEAQAARYLNGLLPAAGAPAAGAAAFPANLNELLLATAPARSLQEALDLMSPMALATGTGREALLSPIGLVHLFRQYFFEFDNFLGPPVEHVWLSPGCTTELVETSTRRVLQERLIEQMTEALFKTERNVTNEEELSEAIKNENSKDTKLGSTVSGGATVLVVHAEASGSASIEETAKDAREQNHKEMRQQSAKLSSEIRTNFKSAFKTVTETTDTRSKRFVIENKTGNLLNYELRRKMRQVGVQMQDVGTQLCWQVYVDDPGRELGVGQLVHLAAKSDLSQYAEVATKIVPDAKGVVETLTILLPVPNKGERSNLGPIAAAGFLGLMAGGVPGVAAGVAAYEVLDDLFGDDEDDHEWYSLDPPSTIHQPYKLTLPDGYQLADAGGQDSEDEQFAKGPGDIALRWLGKNGAHLEYHMTILNTAEGTMDLAVNKGDVTPGEIIEFQARIRIVPTAAAVAAANDYNAGVAAENKKREAEKVQKQKEDLINAVRDRVKLASGIKARPGEDLREEERTVVYRRLLARLMREAWALSVDRKVAHLRSELIKAIFDVDKMLYFVAPEWWQPRVHASQSFGVDRPAPDMGEVAQLSVTTAKALGTASAFAGKLAPKAANQKLGSLGATDVVGWGGEGRGDNYLITEDSERARLGSSLGWLLQLDGDNLRNAFLNAPWVKAVIPVRAGREREALEWLTQSSVEGTDGLSETYAGTDAAYFAAKKLAATGDNTPPTNGEVLDILAADVAQKHRDSMTVITDPGAGAAAGISYLPMDEVFEKGFDPLKGGFRAVDTEPFQVFDQWVEILPTDQIVAVEVSYDPKTGAML